MGNGEKGHIATYFQDDYQNVLSTTSTSVARSSTASENFIMLEINFVCTEPESLGDDQTESESLGAQADGRKEEHMETSLAVHPDDRTGNIRTESRIRWSKQKFPKERTRWCPSTDAQR